MYRLLNLIEPWLVSIGIVAVLLLVGVLLHGLVFALARRVAERTAGKFDEFLIRRLRAPSRVLIPLVLLTLSYPWLPLPGATPAFVYGVLTILFIATGAWLIIAALAAVSDWVRHRYPVDVEDNLRARQMQTQAVVLRRTATLVVMVVAGALILMRIPGIENVGASLLASAGLAGIVVGIAARPTVANLLAGLQLALTQPIRLDDVVIIEGEWGRIEEIRNTFVVVRIWDLRRLIVPLSHFIDMPFQNWTRTKADLLGTVFVHVDYSVPVEAVRRELKSILDASKLWDGKVWNLQVTEAGERTLQLRALMSAADASIAWDLRCEVRERLIDYLQREHSTALPRARAELLSDEDRAPVGSALLSQPASGGPA
jgi:small-conductance mechanosensitive channel